MCVEVNLKKDIWNNFIWLILLFDYIWHGYHVIQIVRWMPVPLLPRSASGRGLTEYMLGVFQAKEGTQAKEDTLWWCSLM